MPLGPRARGGARRATPGFLAWLTDRSNEADKEALGGGGCTRFFLFWCSPWIAKCSHAKGPQLKLIHLYVKHIKVGDSNRALRFDAHSSVNARVS